MDVTGRADESWLRRVLDALPRAVVVTDGQGVVVLWNARAAALYGWEEHDVRGRSILEVLLPSDPLLEPRSSGPATWADGPVAGDQVVRRRDGTTVRVFAVAQPMLDESGELAFVVATSEDVSKVRALEREAFELMETLRLALEAGGLGTWRWDMATGRTDWDERMEVLFGIEPGSFDGSYEGWVALLHPEDRDRVLAGVADAVASRQPYRLEHRVLTPSGDVRWIEGSGRVTVDADDEVTGTIGCCRDVTDRILSEQERERLVQEATAAAERERVQRQRLELVAAVNDALESSDDLEALMRRVTSVVVPHLGDWCSLYVLPSPGSTDPLIETTHTDPAQAAQARELQARFPYDPNAPAGIAKVIRTGEAEFHPEITQAVIDQLERIDGTGEREEIVREFALRSAIAVPLRKRGRVLGGMVFVMSAGQRRFTEEDLSLAQAIAARIAATLENRRLRQLRDRTAKIDARLADVGRRLAAAHDIDEVVAVIAADAPGVIGAGAARVGIVVDGEHLHLTAPGIAQLGGSAGDDDLLELSAPSPIAEAVRTAEIVFIEGEGPAPTDDGAVAAPSGATVASPLFDDERWPIGVLVFEWSHVRTFDSIDETAIETVSRLCGQALRRAQHAGYTEELAAIAGSMAAARTVTDVAELLRDHGAARLGAAIANLRLLDADSSTLRAVITSDLPPELVQKYQRVHVDEALPLSDAVRNGAAVWIPDLDTYAIEYPRAAAEARGAGLAAAAAVPLRTSEGAVVGAVAFAWTTSMHFDDHFRTRLTTLCDLAAQTLERASLYESEHAVVASMQRRLLTALPQVPGLELAGYYEPATAAVGMGGDWYEAIPLDDGSALAVIGDVVGHGVEAVAAMAQLQHLLTGLIRAGTPFDHLFARTNAMVVAPEPIYATALLLHIDHEHERLGYLSAGHPWALLRLPDGTVEPLTVRRHALLGTRLTPQPLEYVAFPPGSVVLAYTDGLIERRAECITDSIGRLADCLAEATISEPLTEALEDLVATVRATGDDRTATSDDIAALLIRSGAGS